MRVVYTSDIHIDTSANHWVAAEAIADIMAGLRPDAIAIAGDAGNTIQSLEEVLGLFSHLTVPKFFVAGNHDVWIEIHNGELIDSREKYTHQIPHTCGRMGFRDLSQQPVLVDNVGFVGSPGWYDYSFADPRLEFTHDDYWRGRFGDEIWWDKEMTFWPHQAGGPGGKVAPEKRENVDGSQGERMRDPEIFAELAGRLDAHLEEIEGKVDRIVAVVHTLPFLETLKRSDPPYYLDAYTGGGRLGRILESHPKVTHCINGHKHLGGDWAVGGIEIHRRTMGRIDEGDDVRGRAKLAVGVIEV